MPHREKRQVWLLLKDGVPSHTSWGFVKTEADAAEMFPDDAGKQNVAAALRGLDPTDGWDATPTIWRRPPSFMYGGGARKLTVNLPRLEGRDLVIGGCRVSLDAAGPPVLLRDAFGKEMPGKPDPEREPHRPDLTVEDEDAMLATAEEMGSDVAFVERGTGKRWRVSPRPDAIPLGHDVLVHRNAQGQKRRVNRVVGL